MILKTSHLFLLSVVLHLAVVFAVGHYRDARLWENGAIAQNIYEGRGFSGGFSIPGEQTSWQAPGYPYLLASAWTALGRGPAAHLAISILQCIAIASVVWPIAGLSRRWFPDIPVWIVQAIAVVAPLYLWYPTRLHHTAFVMALQPWILYAWLSWAGRTAAGSVGTGFLTGAAALVQPVMLGVFGVIGLSRLLLSIKGRLWKQMAFLILAGLTVVAVLIPWTVRNSQVHGRLVLVKNSFGKEFWMGNNPHATGTGYAIGGQEEITNKFPPASIALKGEVSEMELMDALKDEGKDWVREHPADFLKLTAQKILWLWTIPPRDRVRSTGDAEALLFRGVYLAYWVAIVVLAIIGCVLAKPRREFYLITALFVVFYSAIYGLTHVGQARFRGEIEYLLLPAAACATYLLMNWILARQRPATRAN